MKRYKVTLTTEERCELRDLIAAGKAAAKKLAHARILLKADASPGGPAWTDQRIAEAVEVGGATVERVRQRFVEEGLAAALVRKKQDRPSRERKLDGRAEARLIALACSRLRQRAAGNGRYSFLADQLVELEVVDAVCDETVARVLKKRDQAVAERAVVHPAGGETPSSFVRWRMSWSVYHRPYDERRPLVCLDEASKQLIGENGAAPASRAGSSGAVRLRVCPQRHGQPVHDLRTPLGLAACRSHPATDGQRTLQEVLRHGWSRICTQTPTRSQVGDGQPQHPQIGIAVRGVPARPGTPHR